LHLGSERLRIGAVPAHSWSGVSVSEDTVRLDRILGGAEHAGEIGEVVASEEDEIDEIAKLQEAGVFELMLRQGFTVSQVVHDYGDVSGDHRTRGRTKRCHQHGRLSNAEPMPGR
jgi:hypothetical protein